MAAISQPPHLKCICQQDSTPDFYRDTCYQGNLGSSTINSS